MGTLLYFKRLACRAQQSFCAEYWTPKAMGCSLMFWETTIPPIIMFGVKHENNNNNNLSMDYYLDVVERLVYLNESKSFGGGSFHSW